MAHEQTPNIEQTVRHVLSEVLSEVSEEIGSFESNGGGNGADGGGNGGMGVRTRGARPGTPKPPSGEPDIPDLPPEVLDAVEELCNELSADQASALAQLFEAIANQAEAGEEEPEEEEEEFEVKANSGLELSSEEEARAEGERMVATRTGAIIPIIGRIIAMIAKSPALRNAAIRAAKKGLRAFKRWVDGLSSFNPVKWAIKALPGQAIRLLVDKLNDLRPKMAPAR